MPPSKVRIERIEGHRMRQNTFHKRKLGLIKKAIELTVLTDCDCAIILRSGATSTCKEGRLMAYCNKDIQTMLAECQPTLSTIQHFTNNEYARFSKDKDAIGQVAQAITAKAKKPATSNSHLQPSPATIHEQAMAAISLEDDDESDELSQHDGKDERNENAELKQRLSQLEAELASLRAAGAASSAPAAAASGSRRRTAESVRRPLPPPIATNWASGPSASAPAGSKRMLSPSVVAPAMSVSVTSGAFAGRSPTHNSAIQTPEELIAGSDTPKFAVLPQFKKIRQGASPESLQPLDFPKSEVAQQQRTAPPPPAPESAGAGLVYFSPSHLAGMPQQPRSSEAMMLLCSPNAAAVGFDKSPMHRGFSGLSPRVLLQPPSTSSYQPLRPNSGRGMGMDLPSVFGFQAQAANHGQPVAFPPSGTGVEAFGGDSGTAMSGLDTVQREESWSFEQLLATTNSVGKPPLSPAHGLCTPLGRGPVPIEGGCTGLRV